MTEFDWLPCVPAPHVPQIDGDWLRVSVPYRNHTFDILRRTPLLATYRMLGLYQAEGSKSAGATDFSLANANPQLLLRAVDLLATWGLTPDRLSLEVLRGEDEPVEAARAAFACIPVKIVAERIRTGKGGHAGVLHVLKSSTLLRMTRVALTRVFKDEFPSRAVAREYVLGWLDGDGSIIDRGNSIDLMLAGLADEHAVVKRALTTAFDWAFETGSFYKNNKQGTQITLRASEMLDLLDAGAFTLSMNRARLLCCFARRTTKLRSLRAGEVTAGAFVRWGLCKRGGGLTALGQRICDGYARHRAETERARQLLAAAPKGMKGLPYPSA